MNRNSKRIAMSAISASSVLIVAGIIFIVLAVTQKWDILGGLTSPLAYFIYAVMGIASVVLLFTIVKYLTVWRYQ